MIFKYPKGDIIIDDVDYPIYAKYKWHINDSGYAVWRARVNGVKKTIRLHRLINSTPEGMQTDHINRNKLDNRRSNLRTCTAKENLNNTINVINSKGYYFDNRKQRWAVDSRSLGLRSIYVESEQDAKNYISSVKKGKKPIKIFTKRKSLGTAKLTEQDRKEIRLLFEKGYTRKKIASIFNVSSSAIGRLLNGTTWK